MLAWSFAHLYERPRVDEREGCVLVSLPVTIRAGECGLSRTSPVASRRTMS